MGASVGEAVLGKKVGNKAMLYGAIAGTIPDLDIIANYFTDTITATEVHRGLTHSIVFAVLMAPLLGWLVSKIEHRKELGWKPWAWLFFWGLFTHPLLDIFTTWGTQLFWPLDYRIAFNSIFVIDPFYTMPFLICVVMAMFYIALPAGRQVSRKRKQWNRTGLVISTSYLLLTLLLKTVATQQFEERLDQLDIQYQRISTRPAAFNTILWNCHVETADAYLLGDYSFFDSEPITFERYPKNREEHSRLLERPNVKRLIDISKGWFLITEEEGQAYFNDLRFGTAPTGKGGEAFVFSYRLTQAHGEIVATEREKTMADGRKLLDQLWERIKGN